MNVGIQYGLSLEWHHASGQGLYPGHVQRHHTSYSPTLGTVCGRYAVASRLNGESHKRVLGRHRIEGWHECMEGGIGGIRQSMGTGGIEWDGEGIKTAGVWGRHYDSRVMEWEVQRYPEMRGIWLGKHWKRENLRHQQKPCNIINGAASCTKSGHMVPRAMSG